jgi:hypothetical protein
MEDDESRLEISFEENKAFRKYEEIVYKAAGIKFLETQCKQFVKA